MPLGLSNVAMLVGGVGAFAMAAIGMLPRPPADFQINANHSENVHSAGPVEETNSLLNTIPTEGVKYEDFLSSLGEVPTDTNTIISAATNTKLEIVTRPTIYAGTMSPVETLTQARGSTLQALRSLEGQNMTAAQMNHGWRRIDTGFSIALFIMFVLVILLYGRDAKIETMFQELADDDWKSGHKQTIKQEVVAEADHVEQETASSSQEAHMLKLETHQATQAEQIQTLQQENIEKDLKISSVGTELEAKQKTPTVDLGPILERLQQLESQHQTQETKIQALVRENKTKDMEIAELERRLSKKLDAASDVTRLKKQVEALQSQRQNDHNDLEALQRDSKGQSDTDLVNELRVEFEEQKEKIDWLETENETKDVRLQKLQNKTTRIEQDVMRSTEYYEKVQTFLQEGFAKYTELVDVVNKYGTELSALENMQGFILGFLEGTNATHTRATDELLANCSAIFGLDIEAVERELTPEHGASAFEDLLVAALHVMMLKVKRDVDGELVEESASDEQSEGDGAATNTSRQHTDSLYASGSHDTSEKQTNDVEGDGIAQEAPPSQQQHPWAGFFASPLSGLYHFGRSESNVPKSPESLPTGIFQFGNSGSKSA